MPKLLFFRLRENAIPPSKGSEQAVGYDVALPSNQIMIIRAGETRLIKTGLEFHFAPEYELQVRSRSGNSLRGIQVANSPGTVDPDYTGELGVILYNSSKEDVRIAGGDRIAQVVLSPRLEVELQEGRVQRETSRGEGGFGSSGGTVSG